MKKILLMAAVLLSTVGAFAQHEVGSFNLQPKVGLNISDITDVSGTNTRCGFVAGAELEYQATDIFSITGGVLYSMQGCKASGYDDDEDYYATETLKLDYINIPILANIYVAKNFAVKFGIQPGFNINAKDKYDVGDYSYEEELDAVKSFDFSIPVGISYEFKNFQLDARYNWGLTSVGNSDSKNSVFQITLGYKIDL